MVSVTPLASRPKISKIIIDSDLNMGEFDVTATDVTATGNLKVEGEVDGDLDVSGNVTATGNITAGGSVQAGDYIIKDNYTIQAGTSSTGYLVPASTCLYYSSYYYCSEVLIQLPPNVTMSGSIRVYTSSGSCYITFIDVNGIIIFNSAKYVDTTATTITVPAGTNAIRYGTTETSTKRLQTTGYIIS